MTHSCEETTKANSSADIVVSVKWKMRNADHCLGTWMLRCFPLCSKAGRIMSSEAGRVMWSHSARPSDYHYEAVRWRDTAQPVSKVRTSTMHPNRQQTVCYCVSWWFTSLNGLKINIASLVVANYCINVCSHNIGDTTTVLSEMSGETQCTQLSCLPHILSSTHN